MGKASRKMKKKQQQEAEAGLQAEVKTTEQKLFRQIEEEAYSEALDTLVELVQKKSVSPQAMYAGAYAYFMMGDYDRAANWIDNTLRYAPNHVAARILLARLCILQDKADAGLAIFDLLTDKFLPAMKEEERDEIESLAGFYGRNESDKIKREYPHLAAFLQIDKENHEAEEKAEADDARYLRLLAEFQNYKKRTEKEKTDLYSYANEKIMAELLEVLDNFERALEQDAGDGFKEGMELIFTQLTNVLTKAGLAEITALGEDFDPNVHNAVMAEETEEYESGKVSGVMQKGYTLNGKVIRPSMVKVAN